MSEKIEERLAYLERTVDDLSEIVAKQSLTLDKMTRRVGILMEREAAREADGGGGHVFGDEKPPHY